jgi:AcrR family transcriptional regulator
VPKVVDHDERRAAIAAAAASVIADQGVEGATMKAIAARAEVTTGAVTHYFTDKEQVILAALLHADAALHMRVDAALSRGQEPVDALLEALPNSPAARREWLVWRAFEDAAIRSDALRSQHRESMRAWFDAATDAIADWAGCTLDEARLDAEMVVSVVDAIADAASIDPDSWPVARQRVLLEHCLARVLPT